MARGSQSPMTVVTDDRWFWYTRGRLTATCGAHSCKCSKQPDCGRSQSIVGATAIPIDRTPDMTSRRSPTISARCSRRRRYATADRHHLVQQRIYSTPLPVLLATHWTMTEADVRSDLSRIGCPTLVLHGDADRSAPLELTGRPTAALLRNGELSIIAGAGHGFFKSYASVFNRRIVEFIMS